MKRRIVQETIAKPFNFGEITLSAVFKSLREAQAHCGINVNPIIDRKVII